ncbi:MAG: MerR family transcriptional regulator [Gammaproteobacteria bacterium]|jgi:DNA-binding transcriptional MerR regulator
MNQWYVKDLSKLTGVSVQTLHYYDRINLLKPSVRLTNGYRLYSENDLLKLQQIIALKFFGFELAQITTLLAGNVDVYEHLVVQAQFLEKKAKTLFEASQTLKNIAYGYSCNKSIPWETIIKLIEVYYMTEQLEKTWVGKVLTPEELKQYAKFEHDLKTKFTEKDEKAFKKTWGDLVDQVNANLDKDPKSEFGVETAKRCMDLINGLYGKEYANLKHSIWENGFKKGQMDKDHFVTPEVVAWLDKAIDNYYRERIYSILDQVTINATTKLALQWNELMEETFGNSQNLKQECIEAVIIDSRVSAVAKKWLKQIYKF